MSGVFSPNTAALTFLKVFIGEVTRMQTRDEILKRLSRHKNDMRQRFSVRTIGLFGSCVRDASGAKSDIDVLVELDEPTFDHYMDLKFFLEELLEAPVDLVLADCVKPRLRPYIEREVMYA